MRTLVLVACALAAHAASIENRLFRVDVSPASGALWTYRVQSSGRSYAFAAPSFEVDGVPCQAKLASVRVAAHDDQEQRRGWFEKTGDWKPAMSRFPHGGRGAHGETSG